MQPPQMSNCENRYGRIEEKEGKVEREEGIEWMSEGADSSL